MLVGRTDGRARERECASRGHGLEVWYPRQEQVGVDSDARHMHELQGAAEVSGVQASERQPHAPPRQRALTVQISLVRLLRSRELVRPDLVTIAEGHTSALVRDPDCNLLLVRAHRHGDGLGLLQPGRPASLQRGPSAVSEQLLDDVKQVLRYVRDLNVRPGVRAMLGEDVDLQLRRPITVRRFGRQALHDLQCRLLADLAWVALGVHNSDLPRGLSGRTLDDGHIVLGQHLRRNPRVEEGVRPSLDTGLALRRLFSPHFPQGLTQQCRHGHMSGPQRSYDLCVGGQVLRLRVAFELRRREAELAEGLREDLPQPHQLGMLRPTLQRLDVRDADGKAARQLSVQEASDLCWRGSADDLIQAQGLRRLLCEVCELRADELLHSLLGQSNRCEPSARSA
mmetsp:Transcript_85776/g.232688  ORF Transcript_85776/g.232688 Transcript_85776/m.232688 type:complete len:397 (-) Transcript_85776:114-1304(-)